MLIDPDTLAAAARQQQDRLAAMERQRDDIERMRADVKAQARALDQAAQLAHRDAGRLAVMDAPQRAEVVRC